MEPAPPPPEDIPLPPDEDIPLPPDEVIPLPPDEPESSREDKPKKRAKTEDSAKIDFSLEEKEMAKMLGFSNFNSTKGKHVPGNQVGAVHVVKKRRYRQYMNRKGGFNRPLDKVA